VSSCEALDQAIGTAAGLGGYLKSSRSHERRIAATVRVGSRTDFSPYADVDAQGRSAGFAVELFAAVAAVMDIPVTFYSGRLDTLWQSLKSGEIDVLPLVTRMP
jgi:ABC-type amino acid transport substrate-binding protein